MSKRAGGLYVWRTDKPHAIIGLPIIGRHFAYAGMTNSYYWREQQQLKGSVKYGTAPYSWSDLRPKRYKVLPLHPFWTHGRHRRKVMKALETLLIWVLCPVYNDTQQAPYNLRRISRRSAAAQRVARDELGIAARYAKAFLRLCVWVMLIIAAIMIWRWNR